MSVRTARGGVVILGSILGHGVSKVQKGDEQKRLNIKRN